MRTLRELSRRGSAPAAAGTARRDARASDPAQARFAADVRDHLRRTPRQLPTRYLYDDLGSALFEAICRLPWYRITRAEERLLDGARDELARLLDPLDTVVELGSGSGGKLRRVLTAPALAGRPLAVHLVDLSASALDMAADALRELPNLRLIRHEAEYETGLRAAGAFAGSARVLVLFLGSNIGNFDPAESRAFLRGVRDAVRPGDALLLGTDLVKPERELRLAYDDPLGVTAAFDRNLLLRVNRELGADFEVRCWAHRAVWNEASSRVEMHLVAQAPQRVRIPAAELELDFAAGETIWTESSYKYTEGAVDALLDAAGFAAAARWVDRPDAFALTLAEAR